MYIFIILARRRKETFEREKEGREGSRISKYIVHMNIVLK